MSDAFRLAVQNVRSLENATFEFRHRSTTVLIGTNNSGKTTLLEALRWALFSLPSSQNDMANRIAVLPTYYRIAGARTLQPHLSLVLPGPAVLGGEVVTGTPSLSIDFSPSRRPEALFGRQGHSQLLPYAMKLRWEQGPTYELIVPVANLHTIPDVQPSDSYAAVSLRVFDPTQWRPLTPEDAIDQNRANVTYEIAHQLGTAFGQRLHGLAKRTYYLEANRTPSYSAAEEAALAHDNVHTATALLKQLMFLGNAGHWATFQAALKLLFDDIVGLEFRSVDGKLVPHVQFKYGEIRPVADTGFGLRNAIHILIVVCSLPSDAVLLIDEPELGLNQQKQRDLARLLESIRDDVTLVLGTQSEPLIKGLSASATVILLEQQHGATVATQVDTSKDDDLRRLAATMGIDPLYPLEGGAIIYVEGASDREIVSEWLRLNLAVPTGIEIHALGGTGKIAEAFARPMFRHFNERLFFLLDSDGEGDVRPRSKAIEERVGFFEESGIRNYLVLKRREIENYIGHESIAKAANIHPDNIKPLKDLRFWDLKAAVEKVKGPYEPMHISVPAFRSLDLERRRQLFEDENAAVVSKLKVFIDSARR